MNSKKFNFKEQEIYNKYKQITDSINESKHNYALKEINKLYYKSIEIGFSEGITLYYEKYFYIAYYSYDNHLALAITQFLIKQFKKDNNYEKLSLYYTILGTILTRLNDFKSSEYYLKESIRISLKNISNSIDSLSIAHLALANNQFSMGNYDLCLKYTNRGLMDFEPNQIPKKDNSRILIFLYTLKIRALLKLEKIEKAYHLYNLIFKEKTPFSTNDKNEIDSVYIDLMLAKRDKIDDFDLLAFITSLFKKSIKIDNKQLIISLLFSLKEYHIQNKNYKLAYKYANHMLEETDKLKNKQINILNRDNTIKPLKKIAKENSEFEIYLNSELKDIAQYQNNFHGNTKIKSKKLKIDSYFKSLKTLSGDYIGSFKIGDSNNLQLLIVAEVDGKGITASYISFMIDGIIKSIINNTKTINLKKIILDINLILSDSLNNLGFVSMWAGLINLNTNELESINAGHLPTYLINKEEKVKKLIKGSIKLGKFKNLDTIESEINPFNKGDFIIAYTDGITEAMSEKAEMFEEKFDLLINNFALSRKGDFISLLKNEILLFQDNSQAHDDISCLYVEYLD